MINGLFSINGLRASFFVKCPLSFSFCVPLTRPLFFRVLFGMIPNFVLCLASHDVLSTHQNDTSMHQPPNARPSASLSSASFTPRSRLLTPCTSNPAADDTQITHPLLADAMPQQPSLKHYTQHAQPQAFSLCHRMGLSLAGLTLFSLLLSPPFCSLCHSASSVLPGLAGNIAPPSLTLFLCGTNSWASKWVMINQANRPLFHLWAFSICMFPILLLFLTFADRIMSCWHLKCCCKACLTAMHEWPWQGLFSSSASSALFISTSLSIYPLSPPPKDTNAMSQWHWHQHQHQHTTS